MRFADLFADVSRVLFVGAHSDDIEIGCGATLLRLRSELPEVVVSTLVMTSTADRAAEARQATAMFAGETADVSILEFRDGYLPWQGSEVKEALVDRVRAVDPELVFVHRADDLHQDHALVGELALQVCRNAQLVHYEIPKYDGDVGRPNLYVPIPDDLATQKVELLHKVFLSQVAKDWFDDETLRGLMRLRGVESRSRYAEAFWVPKMVLS